MAKAIRGTLKAEQRIISVSRRATRKSVCEVRLYVYTFLIALGAEACSRSDEAADSRNSTQSGHDKTSILLVFSAAEFLNEGILGGLRFLGLCAALRLSYRGVFLVSHSIL
jgi:hypothetical protein